MANDIILDAGLTEILNRFLGLVTNGTLYIAVGSGNAIAVGTETALETEVARSLASLSTVTDAQADVRAFFTTAQANGTIGESGIITAPAAGVLIDKGIESPVQVKTSNQEMIIEKVITIARG